MPPVIKTAPNLPQEQAPISLNWKENPAAKKLLDSLVSIMSKEYIQIAKENPEIFSK